MLKIYVLDARGLWARCPRFVLVSKASGTGKVRIYGEVDVIDLSAFDTSIELSVLRTTKL